MNDLITWYKECAAQYPKFTFVMTAWLCLIAPLGFVPDSVTQSEVAKSFVNFMIGWAPMIKSFASNASRLDWHRFALSVIWVLGPLMLLYFAKLGYRSIQPEFDKNGKKRMGSFGAFWATIYFFVIFVLLVAHGRYIYLSESANFFRVLAASFLNHTFGTSWGLWTLGWLIIWVGWAITGLCLGGYVARKVKNI